MYMYMKRRGNLCEEIIPRACLYLCQAAHEGGQQALSLLTYLNTSVNLGDGSDCEAPCI